MEREDITSVFQKKIEEVEAATNGIVINPQTFRDFYAILIQYYVQDRESRGICTYIVGLQGDQGGGKTSLSAILDICLRGLGYKVKKFSVDDFYMSNEDRLRLAEAHPGNPLYQISRGLPGTHRIDELKGVLRTAKEGGEFDIPIFDKSLYHGRGDITDKLINVREAQDFVICEGWALTMPYVEPSEFIAIMGENPYIKRIFDELDPDHKFFNVVLEHVKQYQGALPLLDNRTVLYGSDIQWVEEWRIEQEERMKAVKGSGMTREEVITFVKPYNIFAQLFHHQLERSTRGMIVLWR